MNSNIETYLKDIGLEASVMDRIRVVESIYLQYFNSRPIVEIFVCNQQPESKMDYPSLWIFSGNNATEFKQFIESDNFDIIILKQIQYLEIFKKNYEYQSSTSESILRIHATFGPPISGIFQARGKNCDYLFKLLKSKLLPLADAG